jgi:hypothetical protein
MGLHGIHHRPGNRGYCCLMDNVVGAG